MAAWRWGKLLSRGGLINHPFVDGISLSRDTITPNGKLQFAVVKITIKS